MTYLPMMTTLRDPANISFYMFIKILIFFSSHLILSFADGVSLLRCYPYQRPSSSFYRPERFHMRWKQQKSNKKINQNWAKNVCSSQRSGTGQVTQGRRRVGTQVFLLRPLAIQGSLEIMMFLLIRIIVYFYTGLIKCISHQFVFQKPAQGAEHCAGGNRIHKGLNTH